MITQFKIYENSAQPKVGDYVIVNLTLPDPYKNFIENNIGRIVLKTKANNYYPSKFIVGYLNVPNELTDNNGSRGLYKTHYKYHLPNTNRHYTDVKPNEILFHSENEFVVSKELEKLKMEKETDKYNL